MAVLSTLQQTLEENLSNESGIKGSASQIVVDFLKKKKNTEKIDVAMVEEQSDGWIVRGTCPIDLEGHQWAERFAVVVDLKGRIKTTDYALL